MHLEIEAIDAMQSNILSHNKNSPDPLFNVQNSSGEGDPAELNDNDLQEEEILRSWAGLGVSEITCPTKVTNQMI